MNVICTRFALLIAGTLAIALPTHSIHAGPTPVGTAFTYQGQLKQGGNNVNATADFQFTLWDAAAGAAQIGGTQPANAVMISDGVFTVDLDFGAGAFGTNARWLEIAVRSPAGGGAFVTLSPRQRITPTPVAQFALGVDGANVTNLNANNLASGTVADTLLSGNVGMLNAAQTFTGANTFSAAPSFTASGGGSPFSVTSTTLVTNLNADLFDGLNSSAFLQSIPNPLALSGTNANHIIRAENTAATTNAAAIFGLATSPNGTTYAGRFDNSSNSGYGVIGLANAVSGNTHGVFGRSVSPNGRGVFGEATSLSGTAIGVYGQSFSTSGRGVFGDATAFSGSTYGVYGHNASPDGSAVFGDNTASTGVARGGYFRSQSMDGIGVTGIATASSGATRGGYFENNSLDGIAVYGRNAATGSSIFGYGGYFQKDGPGGYGLAGHAGATTGGAYGVKGTSSSPTGGGVRGDNYSSTGVNYGVHGFTASTAGRGVYGVAAAASGTTFGVLGDNSGNGSGWGVYAMGHLGASGVKAFRIDHPDDPANKYLLHYAAESPEVINFYSGKITLDGAGEAVVELPHYFAKINKDPRYTLTAVGAPMPNLHIAEEIDESALSAGAAAEPDQAAPLCTFRIGGGAPWAKVSWRVEAIRNDRLMQQRGTLVEIDKQDSDKGTYQHPDLYGQPPEKGMNYDAAREGRDRPHAMMERSPSN